MFEPLYVLAEVGAKYQIWVDLDDFECIALGSMASGANVYHEFAKRRLIAIGLPASLVDEVRYSLQHRPRPTI